MPYYHVPHYCGVYYLPTTTIDIHRPRGPLWLPQISLSTLSKLHDTASSTTLTQTFVNPSQSAAITKAKYNLPLYESCAVVSFRCYVGERLIEGIVKEKDQAKAEYQRAVDRGETAGLLEQQSPDVFSTSIGNIPAGETVRVEIEYIMELKHDAEVDGLRFTIPTSIAPRYGEAPHGISTYPGATVKGGMKIAVHITMPSNIRTVQSPSHPLAVQLGGHVENVVDDEFDPKHALATLSQTSAELSSDFVLIVKCADLSSPRALLETHSTIPHSKALMVTLVPKFNLPSGPKPEIVFVVDRSGSMENRMVPLKSALGVFLKSLPVGTKFNICSFGNRHSFLWPTSQPYSAETLEKAQKHVDEMQANFGGTKILPPIKSTVSRRFSDLQLEIMVLTDGEVWKPEELFAFIEQATVKGDVRLFSLGIGKDVSHALVEGMARVGRGFAQIVADEKEGIEGKVVRMLRGGLSAHIQDYRLEWEGKPSDLEPTRPSAGPVVNTAERKISLFDAEADTDATASFSKLPDFVVPRVLAAPYKLPPLFPFSRTTAYVILSADVLPPSSVWLRGTTPSGDELELEIAVQTVREKGQNIHQLAARKILQELEEGTSYLHSGQFGVDKESHPGTFGDWVQREGVRVGVKYGLASKWTSFVAVQKKDANSSEQEDVEMESVTEQGEGDYMDFEDEVSIEPRRKRAVYRASRGRGSNVPLMQVGGSRQAPASKRTRQTARRTSTASTASLVDSVLHCESQSVGTSSEAAMCSSPPPLLAIASRLRRGAPPGVMQMDVYQQSAGVVPQTPASLMSLSQLPLGGRQRATALIALQNFEGSFNLTPQLSAALGLHLAFMEAKAREFVVVATAPFAEEQQTSLFATLLVVAAFESKLAGEREVWELVVDKAKVWVAGLVGSYEDLHIKTEGLVQEVLAQAQF